MTLGNFAFLGWCNMTIGYQSVSQKRNYFISSGRSELMHRQWAHHPLSKVETSVDVLKALE